MNNLSRKLLVASAMSLLAIAAPQAHAADDGEEIRDAEDIASEAVPGEFSKEARGETIASITLGDEKDATLIEFVALPDGFGRYSVGILEINRGRPGLSDIPRLTEETNPRELLRAIAPPGYVEPPLLAASYDAPKSGRQGWARDIVASMPQSSSLAVASAGCSWNAFANSFNNLYPQINGTKYWYSAVNGDHDTAEGDYYIKPFANTWWRVYNSNARSTLWNNKYKNYTFYNIDKYKTRVRVCQFETGNEFQDRYLAFRYRTEGNVSTGTAYSHQLQASDLGYQYTWVWLPSGGQKNWDWVTLVGGATVYPHGHADDRYFVAVQKK